MFIQIGKETQEQKTLEEREAELIKQEKRWEKEKNILLRENTLKREKRLFKKKMAYKKQGKILFKKPSTSKILISFLFINCTAIEIFSCFLLFYAIKHNISIDFSPLNTLIGTVVVETISFTVYSIKSAKENSKGGIVYEAAMR